MLNIGTCCCSFFRLCLLLVNAFCPAAKATLMAVPVVWLDPLLDRDRESGFRPFQYRARQARGCNTRNFGFGDVRESCKPGRYRTQQIKIKKWKPDFQRLRHACPVGIPEQLVAHIKIHFQRRNRQAIVVYGLGALFSTGCLPAIAASLIGPFQGVHHRS